MTIKYIMHLIRQYLDYDQYAIYPHKVKNIVKYVINGNGLYIRDTKTKEVFYVNYNSEWCRNDWLDTLHPNVECQLVGDYEFYDPARVYSVGYLVSNNGELSKDETSKLVSECIKRYMDEKKSMNDNNTIRFCGVGCNFYTHFGSAEVEIRSIDHFKELNICRKRAGARRSIPFDTAMPENALTIWLVDCEYDYTQERIEETWSKLSDIFSSDFSITKLDLKHSYGLTAN